MIDHAKRTSNVVYLESQIHDGRPKNPESFAG